VSGHSKWSTIKRKKGAVDAKRGKIFTKLIREIATAARMGGGDASTNPRLRLASDKARAANMPKDNIDRAIKKGVGGMEGEAYQEVLYEGYGPGGTALLIETLTDNRNRTAGDVRHALTKYGGNLGSSGCVAYLFEKKGIFIFERDGLDEDALMEAALDAGADDVLEESDSVEVVTGPAAFESIRDLLCERGFRSVSAEVTMTPSSTVSLKGDQARTMLSLAEALDDLDDVQNIYSNFDISDAELPDQ
jgi:YebC/PmpR family DNA-binding regulatory protein